MFQTPGSGGAEYVMSREALKRLGNKQTGLCHEDADVEVGRCLQLLGVESGDARDAFGRNRFLCFEAKRHSHDDCPEWHQRLDAHGDKKVAEFSGRRLCFTDVFVEFICF